MPDWASPDEFGHRVSLISLLNLREDDSRMYFSTGVRLRVSRSLGLLIKSQRRELWGSGRTATVGVRRVELFIPAPEILDEM